MTQRLLRRVGVETPCPDGDWPARSEVGFRSGVLQPGKLRVPAVRTHCRDVLRCLAVGLSIGMLGVLPSPSSADDSGRLRLVQVIEDGKDGVEGLFGARSAAVSPDGKNVYVASEFGDAIVVFARDLMTGQLEFVEAHRNGVNGVDGLGDAREVVVSPEGTHVYVAGAGDSALVVFARDVMTGRLTVAQVQREGLPGEGPDYGPVGLALSPDGANVYAAGVAQNAVAVFDRDVVSGMLTPIEVAEIGLPSQSLYVGGNPGAVRVSPNGAHVYAVGRNDAAVTAFQREPAGGQLTKVGSWRDGVDGVQGLAGAFSLGLSPDGTSVYAAGSAVHSLAVFARDPLGGELTFLEVLTDAPGGLPVLTGTRGVAVSPNGQHVYATGMNAKAVALFSRDPQSGRLAFAEGRRDVIPAWIGMGELHGFALSSDGRHLYLPSRSRNALLVLSTDEGGMAPIVRCVGDCNASGDVTVDELMRGVNIALGTGALSLCEMFDRDGNRAVTVDELVNAVNGALAGCIDPLTPGDHRRTLLFAGERRIYGLHVPPGYDGGTAVPLVVEFHGFQNNPTRAAGLFGLRTVADEEGFLVAWPLGLFGKAGAPEAETADGPSFNGGWCCGGAARARIDDVDFARAVVDAVAAEAHIDRERVYATGLSNGGYMSYRLACEAADVFAAVAPVAGRVALRPTSQCRPLRPIAVIEFAGLNDPAVQYGGSILYPSAAESLAFWRDADGCAGSTPDERVDLGTSYCETYNHCDAGVQVELCSVNASQVSYVPGHILYINPDIDIARRAWKFLSRFRLPAH